MTVEGMLAQMSAAELAEWLAFYRIEPFGEPWRQTGEVCAMIGNANGGKRGGGKFSFHDFLPIRPLIRHTFGAVRQTGKQMLAIFRSMAVSAKGGK